MPQDGVIGGLMVPSDRSRSRKKFTELRHLLARGGVDEVRPEPSHVNPISLATGRGRIGMIAGSRLAHRFLSIETAD
jgi:hypothetical protein